MFFRSLSGWLSQWFSTRMVGGGWRRSLKITLFTQDSDNPFIRHPIHHLHTNDNQVSQLQLEMENASQVNWAWKRIENHWSKNSKRFLQLETSMANLHTRTHTHTHTHTHNGNSGYVNSLFSLTVVISFFSICISKQHTVYLKYIHLNLKMFNSIRKITT